MSFHSRGRSAALSAAISAVLASPVWAAAPGPVQLEEIVVTAQRAEANLQQTPVSVAAISGEQLTERGASTLQDLTSFIPNLQVGSTSLQGGGNGRFAIRGIGQDAGSVASVGLYIDDVYYASGAGNMMGLFDVDRIEVLRGPQGTLFGRNTIGGAIQYVTVKPGDEFDGYVEATGGNFGRTDFEGAMTIPLTDTLSTRVAVGYNKRDGFVRDELNGIDRGEDERKVARLQVRWTPTSSFTADLKGEMLTQESNGRASTIHGFEGSPFPTGLNDGAQFPVFSRTFPVAAFPQTQHWCPSVGPNPSGTCVNATSAGDYSMAGYNSPDFAQVDYAAGSLHLNWDVNDVVSLKSISGHNTTRNKTASDTDGTPLQILRGGGGPANVLDVFSQELQLNLSLLSDRLKWTTGVFYYDEESKTPYGYNWGFGNISPAGPRVVEGSVNTKESKAVFSQATFAFTDRFSATAGVRYTEEDTDSQQIDAVPPITILPKYEGSFNDTSPHISAQFQATEDFMVYASASKGYRAGGVVTNLGYNDGFKEFDPEEAWTYELGLRMEFLDRRLRVNPTVFFTDWKDLQVNTLLPTPERFPPNTAPCRFLPPPPGSPAPDSCNNGVTPTPQNVADAEIKGLEIEALFQVTDRLSIQASAGYLDSSYTEVNPIFGFVYPGGFSLGATPIRVPNLCDGSDPTIASLNPSATPTQLAQVAQFECNGASDMKQAPEFKFSIGGRYTIPLASGSRVITSLDYGWTDDSRSQVANLDWVPLPSYGVLNARVQYNSPDDRWSFAVFGTNLADEYYYLGGTDFARGYTPGATVWDPARPREYGATVKFNF